MASGWPSVYIGGGDGGNAVGGEDQSGNSDSHQDYGGRQRRPGAPKIHGELLKLSFKVSERTASRYVRRLRGRGDPRQRWLTFLANHREAIAAMDFFAIPTVTFKVLYCIFVIEHARRRILHFNVTSRPSSEWIVQQLREAFAEAGRYEYVIFDHDSKFNDVIALLTATSLKPKRTGVQAPWQNGTAERWVGNRRRELLDHVIPLNEPHLRRLIGEYVMYHHEVRSANAETSAGYVRAHRGRVELL